MSLPAVEAHVWKACEEVCFAPPFGGRINKLIRLEADAPPSRQRTKAVIIYKQTSNLRAVQILLGHTKIETTAPYLKVEVEDALALAEDELRVSCRRDVWPLSRSHSSSMVTKVTLPGE